MRIVGGRHRGRRLAAPGGRDVRPTGERTREAMFNILAHADWGPEGGLPEDAVVLDAFCGTGALGLEALSRGAAHALFLDNAPASLALVRANLEALGEAANASVIRADATRPPALERTGRRAATLAFLDPPYGRGLASAALAALAGGGWLAPGAVAVVEEAADAEVVLPEGFAALDRRRYGDTAVLFARHGSAA